MSQEQDEQTPSSPKVVFERMSQAANRHDLRLFLRRLAPSSLDTRRMLGLFRRILHGLNRSGDSRFG